MIVRYLVDTIYKIYHQNDCKKVGRYLRVDFFDSTIYSFFIQNRNQGHLNKIKSTPILYFCANLYFDVLCIITRLT